MIEDNPIRIAQIIGKWVGGGVESFIMNYYKYIDKKEIQFDFICDSDSTNIPYEEIKSMGGRVILVPPYQKLFKYLKSLKRIFKDNNYLIVHSHINTLSVFSLYAAKCAHIPIRIAHSHSTTHIKEIKKNIIKQILRPFSKIFATNYMACSEMAGKWLFGKRTFNNGKVDVLNNAIDLDKFSYNEKIRKEKRKEMKISDDVFVLGHIGRFVETKNHFFLVDIFYELHKKNKKSILILVGDGPLIEKVKIRVKELGLENYVKFLGQIKNVNEIYQVFDVFVLPSLYEGLGLVIIESQCSNLKSICSTNVSKEVNLCNNVEFVPLNYDAQKWANIILNVDKGKRFSPKETLREANYDIKMESKKLLEKYMELKEQK